MNEPEKQATLRSVNYDDLFEDLFGLNLRGLKTLWTCFKSPQTYYQSANSPDWLDRFTPSFRLWFTLIAFTFFFQFFWAGDSSATLEVLASQIAAFGNLPENVTPEMAAREYAAWNFFYLPVMQLVTLFLLAAFYPFMSGKLNFVLRQRKLFITVLPGILLTFPLIMATGFANANNMIVLLFATMFVAFVSDTVTAYRGAFPSQNRRERLVRAFALGIALSVTGLFAGLLASLLAAVTIGFKYG